MCGTARNNPLFAISVLYPPERMVVVCEHEPVLQLSKTLGVTITGRIRPVNRTIGHVGVEVHASSESNRVFAQEPARLSVVVAGAVVVETGIGIEFASGIAKWVDNGSRRASGISERIVAISIGQSSGRVAQRGHRA